LSVRTSNFFGNKNSLTALAKRVSAVGQRSKKA
jgi:hypothetical protein